MFSPDLVSPNYASVLKIDTSDSFIGKDQT